MRSSGLRLSRRRALLLASTAAATSAAGGLATLVPAPSPLAAATALPAAVDAESDSVPTGARYAAAGWGLPGAVVAEIGRTSQPMRILDDPRVRFTGAKSEVAFEFKGLGGGPFPGGNWAADRRGGILFTSDGTAGVHRGEYRIKGSGDDWSDWAPLRIEALARPSGDLFDVEAQSGSSDREKIQQAIDAAEWAGGGVVYSSLGLARQYVIDGQSILIRPGVSYFDLNVRRVDATFRGGDSCDAGNWVGLHRRYDQLFTTRQLKHAWNSATGTHRVVNCRFDSSAFRQPVARYKRGGGEPRQPDLCTDPGTTSYLWPGPNGGDAFNLQHQHLWALFGNNASAAGFTFEFQLCEFKDCAGDAHSAGHGASLTMNYNDYYAIQRGSLVVVASGGTHRMERCRSFKDSPSSPGTRFFKTDIGCGIDCEPVDHAHPINITIRKSLIEQDLDLKLVKNRHTYLIEDCVTCEPPTNFIASPEAEFVVRRTSIHYYRIGGPKGRGNFPPDRIISANVLFDDCDFYAGVMSGDYSYNGRTFVDGGNNDLFMMLTYVKAIMCSCIQELQVSQAITHKWHRLRHQKRQGQYERQDRLRGDHRDRPRVCAAAMATQWADRRAALKRHVQACRFPQPDRAVARRRDGDGYLIG